MPFSFGESLTGEKEGATASFYVDAPDSVDSVGNSPKEKGKGDGSAPKEKEEERDRIIGHREGNMLGEEEEDEMQGKEKEDMQGGEGASMQGEGKVVGSMQKEMDSASMQDKTGGKEEENHMSEMEWDKEGEQELLCPGWPYRLLELSEIEQYNKQLFPQGNKGKDKHKGKGQKDIRMMASMALSFQLSAEAATSAGTSSGEIARFIAKFTYNFLSTRPVNVDKKSGIMSAYAYKLFGVYPSFHHVLYELFADERL